MILTVPGPFSRERERWYRKQYEQAKDQDKGRVAAEFLRDAPAKEWPLAGWLFDAIESWQFSRDPIGKQNLKLVAEVISESFWDHPGQKYLRRLFEQAKRKQQVKDALEVAKDICLKLVPFCQQAKKHVKQYEGAGQFQRFRTLVRDRLDLGFPPDDKLGPKLRPFYACLRGLVEDCVLEGADLDKFLASLSHHRPTRSAAFLAAKCCDVPWSLVESSAKVKPKP